MSVAERIGLLLLALFLFLPGIGSRDLWNPDEPRYAEVTREMRESGDYLVPHLNGRIYSEKPPLLFWLISLSATATGKLDEIAARLPSLAAGVATLFLLFGIARRLFDRQIAWWSVLILGTSGRILWQARVGQIDMLLLALVTLAMYFFVRGWVEGRRGWFRLFFVAAGLGTLAKGPVGLLPPLLSILAFVWISGERRRWREIGIASGLAIWAGIVLLWFVPAAISGGNDYLQTLLFKQNLQRFADPWHHFQPFYYYLTTVPADFFPWSLFLPGALWLGWRRSTSEDRRGFLFAVAWVTITVLFFSISPAKRTVYVLQMFPALALIVALSFAEVARSGERLRGFLATPAALLAGFFALGCLALPRVAQKQEQLAELGPRFLWLLAALLVLLAVAATTAFVGAMRGRANQTVVALASGMAGVAAVASLAVLPRLDGYKSFRPIAQRYMLLSEPGEPYAIYPRIESAILFYTERFATLPADEAELRLFAGQPGRNWLFIDPKALASLPEPLPLVEVTRTPEREKSYVLLGPPPEPEGAAGAGSSSGRRAQVF